MSEKKIAPGLLAVLAILAMTSPLATDMYLPSFTEIATDLNTTASSLQLTLTTFLFGIGAGQLLFGPLSDRYGRRPVLLVALIILVVTSVAMVFVPNIALLITLRFIQGFTGAAGVVLARAIAVDVTTGAESVRALSLIATLVGIAPLVAPIIGGFVAQYTGWRAVFGVLAALTILMLVLSVFFVAETLAPDRRHQGRLLSVFGSVGKLFRDRVFIGYVITFSMAFGAMMSYISASPFVGQVILGMNESQYGLSFSAGAAAMITANLINAQLARRVGPKRMQLVGVSLALTAALALLLIILLGALTIALFIICAFFLTGGAGLVMSNSSALALERAKLARGSGSALLGAGQFLVGGVVSPLVGIAGEDTAIPMGAMVALLAAIAFTFALLNRWAIGKEQSK